MPPDVSLVIAFRTSPLHHFLPKDQAKEDARKAEHQYVALLDTLVGAGLRAVGRLGEKQGHILVCSVWRRSCPQPSAVLSAPADSDDALHLSPAERLRIIHEYVTSIPEDGGLGIVPLSAEWNFVESVLVLHDRKFNEAWIRSWSTRRISSAQLDKIRDQFGDSVALYFCFLSSYTRALIFPAILGTFFYFFSTPYTPLYSILLLFWSTTFVEYWRVKERALATCWGTAESFSVEKRRAQYVKGFPWWKRELRMVASIPVIFMFALVLAILLTAIFVFEAFVTKLYTGPGHTYISLAPTVLFVALVPRLLALYQASAMRFTAWENHEHNSSHTGSLTLKTFALSAVVAYLGLALSAFVYVPFGESVMEVVHGWMFGTFGRGGGGGGDGAWNWNMIVDASAGTATHGKDGRWDINTPNARQKLNPSRLQEQMFAYTVTNQVTGTFFEVGMPFILRALESFWGRARGRGLKPKRSSGVIGGKKKRVVFEDELRSMRVASGSGSGSVEHEAAGDGEKEREEREFLEVVRSEAALPAYGLFEDYSEMVTQFGYVALWSGIWPLAPVMALANNILELRSDAFKITVHFRRPVPQRTGTIGPWLNALTFLTWLGALTNSALVYLFRPVGAEARPGGGVEAATRKVHGAGGRERELLLSALLISLAASHGYTILRAVVRHVVERTVWSVEAERETNGRRFVGEGEEEEEEEEEEEDWSKREVKPLHERERGKIGFWAYDEGLEDIQNIGKDV